MPLNGSRVVEIPAVSKPQNPVAVDFDPLAQLIYWTDIESRTIRTAKLDGSQPKIFLKLAQGMSTTTSRVFL